MTRFSANNSLLNAHIMRFFENFRRSRAIKSYIKKLPRLLARRYGKLPCYTPKQVNQAIENAKLNTRHRHYAVAMFSGEAAFEHYRVETGEQWDYDAIRLEIAKQHFQGNDHFELSDIVSAASDYNSGAGEPDSGGSDGGGI